MDLVRRARNKLVRAARNVAHLRLYRKYRGYTMASGLQYWRNMRLVEAFRHVQGCVVECGVWRGGMSAGMAEVLGPQRDYFLFDSFEGLPVAGEEDGRAAAEWQADSLAPTYFDNCTAPIEFAEVAMRLAGVPRYKIVKGWFNDTLPSFNPPAPIAVLRLDGDWYESTLTALGSLYRHMSVGGLIVVDDYYAWDGCSRAVHDFLSREKLPTRIEQRHGICVIEVR